MVNYQRLDETAEDEIPTRGMQVRIRRQICSVGILFNLFIISAMR